ncbi:MAG: VWA domain-containing protein [Acidobacteriaceae bacterium]|jgi:VWFA-related protein
MSPARIALPLSFLAATALLLAQPPPAPTTPQPPDSSASIPTIHVTSRLVVLDVVVTDGHGRSIKKLKPSDFTILEDGVPQNLSSFTETDAIAEAPPANTHEPLPPNTFAVQPPIAGDLPRTVIVLGALTFADAPQARNDLKKFLKTAPPGVPIAIFRGDWRGVHLIQDFTTDPAVLQQAANSDRILPPIRQSVTLPSDFPPLPSDRPPDARGLASYLASIPGRINLIWISDGGVPPFGEISSAFPEVSNLLHDLNGTTNVVHLSRIAVYPIDANGVIVPGADRADFDLDPMFRNPLTAPLVTTPGQLGSWALAGTGFFSGHDPSLFQNPGLQFGCVRLQDLAASTGGRAFCNTNGYAQAIAQVVETGSHYYTISYTPTNSNWNGAIRRIKIEVPLTILQARESASEKLQDALETMVEAPPRIEYRNAYRARSTPDALSATPAFTQNAPAPSQPQPQSQTTPVAAHPTPPITPIQVVMGLGAPTPDQIHFNLTATPAPEIERLKPGTPLPKGNFLAPAWRDQPYRNLLLHFSIDPADLRFTVSAGVHHDVLEFVAVLYRDDGAVVNSFSGKATLTVDDQGYARIMSAPLTFDHAIASPIESNLAHYYLRTAVHEVPTARVGAIEIPVESIHLPSAQNLAAAQK